MNRSKITRINQLEKEVLLSAQAEKVEMTLNTSNALASGLLIQRLTELYENPIEATVRETVSNAMDAVTESFSGKRPEVKIIAPTSLHPVLTIKDNGVGMDYEDLKEIYSKYGSSTKTDNMETIGAYGLGAKSPLAYGTEFTVTSVKNNQKTTIIVAREELTNYIKIVNSVKTNEPSGTTVSVPVNSRDIGKFVEYINKYREIPMDKDIDLIINGEKIEENHTLITTELKIYESSKETVLGKVWINITEAIDILNIGDYNLKRQLKFVIGGWGYDTPSGRNKYYSKRNNKIFIELKPGIVGFNSSRDAILENDRYYDFEELVVEYVNSERFTADIIKEINKMPIDDFKKIMSTLIYNYKGKIEFESDGLSMKCVNINNNRTLEFEYLVHEETGFTINDILKNVPKVHLPTIVFREEKSRHSKTSKNGLMENRLSSYRQFDVNSITLINQTIDEIMNKETDGHNLNNLIINMASLIHFAKQENTEMRITFVTDIEDIEEIKQLKTGRKSLVQIRNGKELDNYNSILVYTKHTKKEMEEMIETIKVDDLDIKVESAENIIQEIKDYRSTKVIKREQRTKQMALSTTFYKYTKGNSKVSNLDDVASDRVSFVVLNKDTSTHSSRLEMINIWYCNENNLNEDEVDMYVSRGMHTITDLKMLKNVFNIEIFRDPYSDNVGLSTLYYDEFHNKIAQINAIRNDSVNTSEKAFVRLVTGIYENSFDSLTNSLLNTLQNLELISNITDIPFTTLNQEKIAELKKFDDKIFGDLQYSSDWKLNNEALTHIASKVNEKHLEIAQNLLTLIDYKSFQVTNGKVKTVYQKINDLLPSSEILTSVYKNDIGTPLYKNIIKSSVKSYMEFAQDTVNQLLLINIQ